jgi:hypothetical protein
MALSEKMLEQLVTPKQGHMTTRLPTKCAKTNAAIIAELKKKEVVGGLKA